jgi:hypothetical protein
MFLSKKKRKLIALKLKEEGPRPKSSKNKKLKIAKMIDVNYATRKFRILKIKGRGK